MMQPKLAIYSKWEKQVAGLLKKAPLTRCVNTKSVWVDDTTDSSQRPLLRLA